MHRRQGLDGRRVLVERHAAGERLVHHPYGDERSEDENSPEGRIDSPTDDTAFLALPDAVERHVEHAAHDLHHRPLAFHIRVAGTLLVDVHAEDLAVLVDIIRMREMLE